jgi:pilus assembly protein Flp/PilA
MSMNKLAAVAKKFFTRKEEGATAVEYGIMVAAIAAVIIATVIIVGADVEAAFVLLQQGFSSIPGV